VQERSSLSERLERELGDAGIFVAVEDSQGTIVLSGLVESTEEREAARDIVAAAVGGGRRVDVDNVQVSGALPADSSLGALSEAEIAGFDGAEPGLEDPEAMDPGDFTDQETMSSSDSMQAASLSGSPSDDPDLASSGNIVHVPPIDPVGDGAGVIGGFQSSSMSSIEVERSSDGTLGDEAIRDTILQELREDAATSGLALEVSVFRGIATLTGRVADIDDVEAAEEVTGRVPGVVEVIEEIEVERLG
jgi:osmotically-inducible protein OsmY